MKGTLKIKRTSVQQQISKMLNEEIKWHEKDYKKACRDLDPGYVHGFLEGLKQAKLLVLQSFQEGE